MKNIYLYLSVIAFLITIASCEDELIQERLDDNPLVGADAPLEATPGNADFTSYVSFGNSLTAGLMDAALYDRGQQSSFANLLGARFELAGGGTFQLPDINAANGFNVTLNDFSDPTNATFGRFFLDLSIPGPRPFIGGDPITPFAGDNASVSNMGVPGMRLIELTANGYGLLNGFYGRFALDPSSTSVLEQGLARNPTFMTFWLGNNDALTWATGGGVGPIGIDDQGAPDPSNDLQPNALVSTTSFNADLQGSLDAIFGSNPSMQGVILNVPNVTLIPFFQAVQWNAIPLDAATATAANAGYAGYNAILQALTNPALGPLALSAEEVALRQISFSAGNNAIVVSDNNLTDITNAVNSLVSLGMVTSEQATSLAPLAQARQLKSAQDLPGLIPFGLPAEIVTLGAGAVLGTLADPNNPASIIGVGVPLGDQFTLTVDEIGLLLQRIGAFNAAIAAQANSREGLVLFDANSFFTGIAINGGIQSSGLNYTPDFSPNGVFSTDGIHPNPAGHAILTNELIQLINTSFNSNLPLYDASAFTTVLTE